MIDEKARKISHDAGRRILAGFNAIRCKSPGEVRFSQGDYEVLMKSVPAELAALHGVVADQAIVIAALERRIVELESKHERRLEIVRQAAMSGRSTILEGQRISPEVSGEDGEAANAGQGEVAASLEGLS